MSFRVKVHGPELRRLCSREITRLYIRYAMNGDGPGCNGCFSSEYIHDSLFEIFNSTRITRLGDEPEFFILLIQDVSVFIEIIYMKTYEIYITGNKIQNI